ncbi:unnamed protein product [Psylliodes chrysocephalus]|uniref:DNA-directed DNA polymerase n=1 Tax=Psylliodes chrysocephalus TaxID=3402493 RepID=A0A9P0CRU5_9CUCU|nr:unnamed protein product [Psylliodes chrysocephala]
MSVDDLGDYGYVLEVDVTYPHHLQDKHTDLPFLVENIVPSNSKTEIPKLVPNLNHKDKYILHYRNFKEAINNGLIVTKIHRALKFKQSRWLKKYIDLNTNMRNNAKDTSEKNHFKRMVNSVYGKTMENVDDRRDIYLKTHWASKRNSPGANNLIARPNFESCSIFSENFVAIHMGRTKICYNKPLYVGFTVLELSKFDFLYNKNAPVIDDQVASISSAAPSKRQHIEVEEEELNKQKQNDKFGELYLKTIATIQGNGQIINTRPLGIKNSIDSLKDAVNVKTCNCYKYSK